MYWDKELVSNGSILIGQEWERESAEALLELRVRFYGSFTNTDDFTASRCKQIMLLFEG